LFEGHQCFIVTLLFGFLLCSICFVTTTASIATAIVVGLAPLLTTIVAVTHKVGGVLNFILFYLFFIYFLFLG